MEYLCKIRKNDHNNTLKFGYSSYASLPLFDLKPERVFEIPSKWYYIEFLIEDRYTPDFITIWPPKLTEGQFKIINSKGNWCVENDLSIIEFEI